MGNVTRFILALMMVMLLPHFVVSFSIKTTTNINTDQSALLALKAYIVSDPQKMLKTNWSTATSVCNWIGVTCGSRHQRVIALNLSSMLLTGTIPSQIGNLSFLTSLDLMNNSFYGSLPDQFTNLHRLKHIDLSWNNFCGEIPYSFPKLQYLSLRNNIFAGEIRSDMFEHLPRLQVLSLTLNKLSSEIPMGLFKCKELQVIDFEYNRMMGGILPKEIGNLTMLRILRLGGNMFEGVIPYQIGDLLNLEELSLCNTLLKGHIPPSISNLTRLTILDLSTNSLTGVIPHQIGNLLNLEELILYSNMLKGPLPSFISNLTRLTTFDLSHNSLSGQIPSGLFERLPKLQRLDLGGNKLSGKIPLGLFNCKELQSLILDSNRLEEILQIGNLTMSMLEVLDLHNNLLKGIIPYQISNLTRLKFLYLSNNFLTGIIPYQIGNLTRLRFLDLSNNSLTGVIPHQIGNLLNLEQLSIPSNMLEGPLPSSIGNIIRLTGLQLFNNSLTGVIPHQIGNLTCLQLLDLSSNSLTGHIPITLGNLRYLHLLDISDNDLSSTLSSSKSSFLSSLANCRDLSYLSFARNPLISGYLPAFIGNSSIPLQYFDASSCNISGRIPGEIGNWNPTNLGYLCLNGNQLEGILPLSLINCSELVVLNVANNNLSDTFPHWLGMLPRLRVLILRSNRFHGSIQDSLTNFSFSKLQMVDLSHNDFTGLLPTEFFQNLKALKEEVGYDSEYFSYSVNLTIKGLELEFTKTVHMPIFTCIDLSDNGFHGEIPKVVGELRLLLALNLSHNSLTGPIPPSFGNLAALESLDLSFNKLSGRIPSQLTNLTFLEVLRFWNNNLVGPIPQGKQFNTFENDSYRGNLGLCGFPLSKECRNDERSQEAQDEEDNGNGIAFIWKVAMMGYGCGMVLGISIAYIVFTTGRPWWLVRMIERDLQNKVSSWFGKKRE
ncbi:hypothetical protein ES332_D01G057700v1 [Gossypium tomentosum]|uniref:Uncharacterized protein n=1 Tax=Gossypium tomentosum TaxID=34277 RepID=A0A5D2M5L3_GOSTO|nr:hypothetical protein ES332_D01G057700v1 [Gossypium tomentosum]